MKIGIFDSGIGGLNVLHLAMASIPEADFVYYADEKHVPYGEKSVKKIKGFVSLAMQFLVDEGCDAIVIACNTATSVADMAFRKQFPVPIIGMEPAVKPAMRLVSSEKNRILVAATPVTINGEKLHNLVEQVDSGNHVDLIALPKLVYFAEKGEFNSREVNAYLKESFSDITLSKYSTLVLGCTHFNYFKKNFLHIFPDGIRFVDGNTGTIMQLKRKLDIHDTQKSVNQKNIEKPNVKYYFSGELLDETEEKKLEPLLIRAAKMHELQ